MANPDGPPDRWSKISVSSTYDPNAQTSTAILAGLNENFQGVTAATTVMCSDGTFIFIGYYGS